jgi:hypothetical protein
VDGDADAVGDAGPEPDELGDGDADGVGEVGVGVGAGVGVAVGEWVGWGCGWADGGPAEGAGVAVGRPGIGSALGGVVWWLPGDGAAMS